MKSFPRISLLIICMFVFRVEAHADSVTPDWHWVHTLGAKHSDAVTVIKYDAAGNLYIGGYFQDTIQLSATTILYGPSGVQTGFVAKYFSDGTFQWAQICGGEVRDIVFEHSGRVIVGAASGSDAVIGHYSPSGSLRFAQYKADVFHAMAVDADDNLVIACDNSLSYFSSTTILQWTRPGGSSVAVDAAGSVYVAGGSQEATLQKYSRDGTAEWSKVFEKDAGPIELFCDTSAGVYLAAKMYGQIDFGNGVSFPGNFQICAAKFDTGGKALWGKPITSIEVIDAAIAGAIDGAGNLYLGCKAYGTAIFGKDTLNQSISPDHIYLAEVSTTGALIRVLDIGHAQSRVSNLISSGIGVNAQGDIAVCGQFDYFGTFGSIPFASKGDIDGFFGVATYHPKMFAEPKFQFTPLACAGSVRDTVLWVRNTGVQPLTIDSVRLKSTRSSFDVLGLGAPPIYIPVGDSEKFMLRFHPSVVGDDSADLVIRSNALHDSVLVKLYGRLEHVAFQTSTDTLAFRLETVNDTGAAKIVLRNSGTEAEVITDSTTDLFVCEDPVIVIPAGDSAVVHVTFIHPPSTGIFLGTLVIKDVCGDEHDVALVAAVGSLSVRDQALPGTYSLSIAPQPATDHVSITFVNLNAIHPVARIIDVLGRTCWQGELSVSGSGEFQTVVDVSLFVSGLYVCEMGAGNYSARRAFVVH